MSNEKGANGQTMICKKQRAKDSATRTPQKIVNKQGWLAVPVPLVIPVVLLLSAKKHHIIWKSCWTPVYVNKYKEH